VKIIFLPHKSSLLLTHSVYLATISKLLKTVLGMHLPAIVGQKEGIWVDQMNLTFPFYYGVRHRHCITGAACAPYEGQLSPGRVHIQLPSGTLFPIISFSKSKLTHQVCLSVYWGNNFLDTCLNLCFNLSFGT
jgi:hypothetical protein